MNNSTNLNLPVTAFWAGSNEFNADYICHYETELTYICNGSAIITYNGRNYTVQEGSLLIFAPFMKHTISALEAPDFKCACVRFNASILLPASYMPSFDSCLKALSLCETPEFMFNQEDFAHFDFNDFFHTIIDEAAFKSYGYDNVIISMLSTLMTRLVRIWHEKGLDIVTQDSGEYSFSDVISYINSHFNENLNIDMLAHRYGTSYSYFAKIFHKNTGLNCTQYIDQLRLDHAKKLLLFTDKTLSDIAVESGFTDCSHFIRCFKRSTGTTPKQFRLCYK